ncbi:alpha/beta hydrolase [Nocardioides sp. NPDC127503]|uniref:alpha/beta hydrolase n=1 Tax=Nocardioides sp. NPDC127503 TaxID=3154516 RepID=UPI00332D6086
MRLHPDAERFLELTAEAPPLDTLTVEQNREDLEKAVELTGDAVPMERVEDAEINGVPVRVYVPFDAAEPQPCVVYFHGGGWTIGTLDLADTTVREIAAEAGAIGISVDYRLAPEHPFPAAIEDALAVVTAVLRGETDFNIDPEKVAVAGDSAGGNISAVVAQELRGHTPALVHQGLIYPVTDLSEMDTASYREFSEGYFLRARDLVWFFDQYISPDQREDVRASPARNGDLTGLPTTTLIVAECDPLRDEGEAYGRALAEQGNEVSTVRFLGQTHPFVYLGGVVNDAHVARRFLGQQLGASFTR